MTAVHLGTKVTETGPHGGRPVAGLIAPLIRRVIVLGLLLAGIAAAGVLAALSSVSNLAEDLQPAAAANHAVLQDVSDMQSAARFWARTGERVAIEDYRQAETRLPGHESDVRRFAENDAELEALVDRQSALAEEYLTGSAEPRLDRPGGPDTPVDPQQVRDGVDRFRAFRAAHAETTAAFDDLLSEARDGAERLLRGTVLAILLTAAIGLWVIIRSWRRMLAEISDPLEDLELVVQRMAAQDRDARAADEGPREVRAVASALNELAEAQARAGAVERQIQDELRSLDTAHDDFVSNVSHELRTPLTTISGYLELVAEEFDGAMQPRHEKMLAASRRNISRLRQLIEDLLTLSRAEARESEMGPVDLVDVAVDVAVDVRMAAARRGIAVHVDVPESSMVVLGDRPMLHRALLNVVSNAVKFSREGGVVEICGVSQDGHRDVVVRDHGIGIPAAELDRLGTRFFRASNAVTNEIAGTGLGVRIVQTIVDKHGGRVVISSDEGGGTTVTVRLPAQAPPS